MGGFAEQSSPAFQEQVWWPLKLYLELFLRSAQAAALALDRLRWGGGRGTEGMPGQACVRVVYAVVYRRL